MRLDKFLKVARIIKRRSVANTACDSGHVHVNGRPAKAGLVLKVGDEIVITFGEKTYGYRVLLLNEHANKDESTGLYEVIS